MNYFKVNYDKLKNLEEKNYYLIVITVIFIILYLLLVSCFIKVKERMEYAGIVNDGVLKVGVNNSFSDIIKNNNTLKFKEQEMHYKVKEFGEYEVIDNEIYENIYLVVDGQIYDNEVGVVTFYYHENNLCKYIFKLFK